ncbi:MAG: glycogen/starch/alpha-glucan phosphorylase [Acutalibacteraceae bacterium]
MNNDFRKNIENALMLDFSKNIENASAKELYSAIGKAYNSYCTMRYAPERDEKRACYFSAEFLIGKLTKSNLFNSGLLDETEKFLKSKGRSLDEFENFDDPALGNGGLGRLAACFLDSAASCDIPLDGYGIRYKYGYFRQNIDDNKQKEEADNWLAFYDAFGMKREEKAVEVCFNDFKVKAVPYIYFIPGFRNERLNKLVLFDAQPLNGFDYSLFDKGEYMKAYSELIEANVISASLYPNDNGAEGKKLRLKQQYFFSSASLQYIIKELIDSSKNIDEIEKYISVQLNDTHPVISIPEFIRLMMQLGKDFDFAFEKAKKIFAYTNHTVLAEALEKWDISLFKEVLPDIYNIIELIEKRLENEFSTDQAEKIRIIDGKAVHMANLACYVSKSINGVAAIHSEIIKEITLNSWYEIYPDKFNNKTNGVTQRRWLFLANPELYRLLEELTHGKINTDFYSIKEIEKYSDDKTVLDKLFSIRKENKRKLCEYISEKEHINLDCNSVFDVQIKRLHEYKRQLMNILAIIGIYLRIKEGSIVSFPKTVFLFGAKSAPGYHMAKKIIEFINVVAGKINDDEETNEIIKIIYVSNYDVSYAEKIIPAADISEQISLAGKEASGTSNMKFMMNGAVTLGTLDGANIEITEKAGKENNYIFGLNEEEVREYENRYDPLDEYESNDEIKRIIDTLKDDSFCEESRFEEIYNSLLNEDRYFVLKDLPDYIKTKIKAIKDTQDKYTFMKKCLLNTANSAGFSSDRTIKEYAEDIWFKEC